MINRWNVWRKPISNIPRCKMLYCKVLISKSSTGWRWRIMRDTDQLASGVERTRQLAEEMASAAKKRATGKLEGRLA